MKLTHFQNDYMTLNIQQGIVHVYYKKNITIDIKAAEIIVRDRLQFQDHLSYPILCNISDVNYADHSAIKYLADNGSLLAKAVTLLSNDARHYSMGNYFVQVHEPYIPTKIFRDKEEALLFLHQFKKEYL